MGRFLQRDPIGTRDQVNLYAYVGNNPVGYVDPRGMNGKPVLKDMTQEFNNLLSQSRADLQSAIFSKYLFQVNSTWNDGIWNIKNVSLWKDAAVNWQVLISGNAVSVSDLGNFLVWYNGYYAGMPLNGSTTELETISYLLGQDVQSIYDAWIAVEKWNYGRANPSMSTDAITKRALADELMDRPWYDIGYSYARWLEGDWINSFSIDSAIKIGIRTSSLSLPESNALIDEACWDNLQCRIPR